MRGAAKTLRRDGPRLALSGYHHPYDVEVLPAPVKDLQPAYIVQWEEQVRWGELDLFAHVPAGAEVEARTA